MAAAEPPLNSPAADSLGYLEAVPSKPTAPSVTAIACFATNPDSYPNAIARALALGDDTDTLMAMTGAISGASYVWKQFPHQYFESRGKW